MPGCRYRRAAYARETGEVVSTLRRPVRDSMPGTFGSVWKQHRIPSSVSRLNRRRFDGWLRVLGAASRCDAATEEQHLPPPAAVRSAENRRLLGWRACCVLHTMYILHCCSRYRPHTARYPDAQAVLVGKSCRRILPAQRWLSRPHARAHRPSHLAMAGSFEPDPDGIILAGGATISYFPVRSYPDPSPQAAQLALLPRWCSQANGPFRGSQPVPLKRARLPGSVQHRSSAPAIHIQSPEPRSRAVKRQTTIGALWSRTSNATRRANATALSAGPDGRSHVCAAEKVSPSRPERPTAAAPFLALQQR